MVFLWKQRLLGIHGCTPELIFAELTQIIEIGQSIEIGLQQHRKILGNRFVEENAKLYYMPNYQMQSLLMKPHAHIVGYTYISSV